MASLVWMSIFGFLAAELLLTLILVMPIPLKISARCARFAQKGPVFFQSFTKLVSKRMKNPTLFIGIGLGLALAESLYMHQHILARIQEERRDNNNNRTAGGYGSSYVDYFYPGMHDKERKYKSERNIYLAGFALTLLFAIGRIVTLLRESVELHEETERLEKALASSSSSSSKEGGKKRN